MRLMDEPVRTYLQGWKKYWTMGPLDPENVGVLRKYFPMKEKKIIYCKNLDKRRNSEGKF